MRGAAILLLATMLVPLPARAACKLALALGLDISASVDDREYRLQIGGLADAIGQPEVIAAMLSPAESHVAVAVYEWSGFTEQKVTIPWTVLDSAAAVHRLAGRLRTRERPAALLSTAVGKGVEFGARLLAAAPPCRRRVLDISGDGVNNIGLGPRHFYRLGLLEGVTVNGLVIRGAAPDPLPYYQSDVIFGPESFVALAEDFDDYREAMKMKLLREIAPDMVLGRR